MKCDYCGAELTEQEIKNTAEAEDVTDIIHGFVKLTEVMCDKCAEGDGPYQ